MNAGMSLELRKVWRISRVDEETLTSQGGFCPMELVRLLEHIKGVPEGATDGNGATGRQPICS